MPFLQYVEELHASRAPELRAAMDRDGGYPLHLDTGRDGRGTMLVALSGWRRWLLDAWTIPTERAEFMLSALQSIAGSFGTPRAIRRDLGPAMIDATDEFVKSLKNLILVLACHAHFLSDLGEDLLEKKARSAAQFVPQGPSAAVVACIQPPAGPEPGPEIDQGRKGLRLWLESDPNRQSPEKAAGTTVVRRLA